MGGNNKTDACTFWVSTYPWWVPVFRYKPQVFTWREQFLHALTGFVSCVGINLLAKMLVVCEIIVIQNRPSTHVIDATSFVQKQWWESCGVIAAVAGVIFSYLIRPKLAKKLQIYEAWQKRWLVYAPIVVKLLIINYSQVSLHHLMEHASHNTWYRFA